MIGKATLICLLSALYAGVFQIVCYSSVAQDSATWNNASTKEKGGEGEKEIKKCLTVI